MLEELALLDDAKRAGLLAKEDAAVGGDGQGRGAGEAAGDLGPGKAWG